MWTIINFGSTTLASSSSLAQTGHMSPGHSATGMMISVDLQERLLLPSKQLFGVTVMSDTVILLKQAQHR